jgi:hypothetical protein
VDLKTVGLMTEGERESLRELRRNETGTMPPCPWCGRPRVQRSDYVRCCRCGVNWLDGQDLNRDPRLSPTLQPGQPTPPTAPARSAQSVGSVGPGRRAPDAQGRLLSPMGALRRRTDA